MIAPQHYHDHADVCNCDVCNPEFPPLPGPLGGSPNANKASCDEWSYLAITTVGAFRFDRLSVSDDGLWVTLHGAEPVSDVASGGFIFGRDLDFRADTFVLFGDGDS